MYTKASACRICGNSNLVTVLELGEQCLTGVFPRTSAEKLTKGPLTLVKCVGEGCCGLLQLAHSYSLAEMYGDNYGYRSGLNPSMVAHLRAKVKRIEQTVDLSAGDLVIDIGSNDATTLKQYSVSGLDRVGVDPTGKKFLDHYGDNIRLIPEFFSRDHVVDRLGDRKAQVITSFSMFYDLEDPTSFMKEVASLLADRGIWVFEQSYMPLMLDTNSYDTVCHEHLEYYSLAQIQWMAQRAGLEIVDVELNDVNGGSFSVTAQKKGGGLKPTPAVRELFEAEQARKLDDLETYLAFAQRVQASKAELLRFFEVAKEKGLKIFALGASTKANVLLQYCNLGPHDIAAVGEINTDKFGSYTPGSAIPIVDEATVLSAAPDYVLVLPWHFRAYFLSQEKYRHLKLVFPLPTLSTLQ